MASIPLSKSKTTLVDDEDFIRVCRYSWYYGSRYARATVAEKIDGKLKTKAIYLHRFILGLKNGDRRHVDHINGDRLDNRLENLRICPPAQNAMNAIIRSNNKTGVRGVSFDKTKNRWIAQLRIHGEIFWRKRFKTLEDAIAARIEKEKSLYGEFRRVP